MSINMNRPSINYSSPDWAGLEEWLQEELQHTYQRLASPIMTETETQQLRGRASLISQMLDFKKLPAAFKAAD